MTSLSSLDGFSQGSRGDGGASLEAMGGMTGGAGPPSSSSSQGHYSQNRKKVSAPGNMQCNTVSVEVLHDLFSCGCGLMDTEVGFSLSKYRTASPLPQLVLVLASTHSLFFLSSLVILFLAVILYLIFLYNTPTRFLLSLIFTSPTFSSILVCLTPPPPHIFPSFFPLAHLTQAAELIHAPA